MPAEQHAAIASATLDVDLESAPTPQVVTALLASNEGHVCADALWELTVGERVCALLAVLAREDGRPLWIVRRCANDACAETIEIDLSPVELVALARESVDKA